MTSGICIGHGKCDMSPAVLRQLGVHIAPRACITQTRFVPSEGSKARRGHFEIARNGVHVGFLTWDERGRFYWHPVVEH